MCDMLLLPGRATPRNTGRSSVMSNTIHLYDCEICGSMHPWLWSGDCRDDTNRIDNEYAYAHTHGIDENDLQIVTMTERVEADERGEA